MSDPSKTTLHSVDWERVRMFSKEGKMVHVMTDEGPLDFEFATENEANDAVEEYFRRQQIARIDQPASNSLDIYT